MKKLLLSILVVIGFTANAQFSTKNGGHCFTMSIPDYMVKAYDLNDVASLQYQSAVKDAYVVVIEDAKDHLESLGVKYNNPSDVLNSFSEDYMKDAKGRKLTPVKTSESNGNKFAQTEFTWKDEDGEYFMLITVTETNGHFYKTLCWTSLKNKEALIADFDTMAKSIKD
ncbi:MAG: hypothetical protein ACK44D_07630 [Bacteroidia bacterium]